MGSVIGVDGAIPQTQTFYWCSRKIRTYKVTHYIEKNIKAIKQAFRANKTGGALP